MVDRFFVTIINQFIQNLLMLLIIRIFFYPFFSFHFHSFASFTVHEISITFLNSILNLWMSNTSSTTVKVFFLKAFLFILCVFCLFVWIKDEEDEKQIKKHKDEKIKPQTIKVNILRDSFSGISVSFAKNNNNNRKGKGLNIILSQLFLIKHTFPYWWNIYCLILKQWFKDA